MRILSPKPVATLPLVEGTVFGATAPLRPIMDDSSDHDGGHDEDSVAALFGTDSEGESVDAHGGLPDLVALAVACGGDGGGSGAPPENTPELLELARVDIDGAGAAIVSRDPSNRTVQEKSLRVLLELVRIHGNSVPEFSAIIDTGGAGMNPADVDALVNAGVVQRRLSDFDDHELAVKWDRINWHCRRVVRKGCLCVHYEKAFSSLEGLSKVELAQALTRQGWKPGARVPFEDGAEKLFKAEHLFRSKSYFIALLSFRDIFQKTLT